MRFAKYLLPQIIFIILLPNLVFSNVQPLNVTLSSQYQSTPGGFTYIDLIIDQSSPEESIDIDGMQLMLAYDTSKLTIRDVHSSLLTDSCNWKVLTLVIYSDNEPFEYLWIEALTEIDSDCFKSGDVILTLEFQVSDDISLGGDSTSVDFIWLSCEDNRFWSNQNDTILISNNIFNSESVNIADETQSFPSETGPNTDCHIDPPLIDTTIVKEIDFYSTKVIFQLTTDISESIEGTPGNYHLSQNYPNPFNPTTNIDFYLPIKTRWELEIINITGQQIRKYDGENTGRVSINWDGENNNQLPVASGIYFYKITTQNYSKTKKMILLK